MELAESAIPRWRPLEWDSGFFGFGVARVEGRVRDRAGVEALRHDLARHGIRVAYLAIAPDDRAAAAAIGGEADDDKVTYARPLSIAERDVDLEALGVRSHRGGAEDELVELGIAAGERSRFARDPRFGREWQRRMYRVWIERSLAREIAFDVLIAHGPSGLAEGLLTLGQRGGCADIGLVAVGAEHRGRGVGSRLIRAALARAAREGFSEIQVVTQGDNEAACQLYARHGFTLATRQLVYHLWSDT